MKWPNDIVVNRRKLGGLLLQRQVIADHSLTVAGLGLNLFVTVEAFYLFSCRSLTRSAWRVGFFSNRWLLAGQVVGQLAITTCP